MKTNDVINALFNRLATLLAQLNLDDWNEECSALDLTFHHKANREYVNNDASSMHVNGLIAGIAPANSSVYLTVMANAIVDGEFQIIEIGYFQYLRNQPGLYRILQAVIDAISNQDVHSDPQAATLESSMAISGSADDDEPCGDDGSELDSEDSDTGTGAVEPFSVTQLVYWTDPDSGHSSGKYVVIEAPEGEALDEDPADWDYLIRLHGHPHGEAQVPHHELSPVRVI